MCRVRRRSRDFVSKAAHEAHSVTHEVPCIGGGICLVRDGGENAGEDIGN